MTITVSKTYTGRWADFETTQLAAGDVVRVPDFGDERETRELEAHLRCQGLTAQPIAFDAGHFVWRLA